MNRTALGMWSFSFCFPRPVKALSSEWVKTNVLYLFRGASSILSSMQRIPLELSDSFAQVVEQHREAKGLSRAALAAQAGLHQTYIGLLEHGRRSPNLDTAQAIAKGLGVPLSQLIVEAERIQRKKSEH